MKTSIILGLLIYAAGFWITYTGACAYWDYCGQNRWADIQTQEEAAQDNTRCISMAILPPAWIFVFFLTDFYRHGFRIGVRASERYRISE